MTSGTSADRFDTVFGSLAAQARSVIDADLAFWQRTIAHFNYGDGGADNYDMTIQMNATPIGSGNGSVGANGGVIATRNNKPSAGSMGIGWRSEITPDTNTAAGYYLDPKPFDFSEYAGIAEDAFAASPGAVQGGNVDLFGEVLHELGHAMGLVAAAQTRAFAVNTGVIDTVSPATSPPSTLWLANNGALWTSYDSGGATGGPGSKNGPQHFAPPGASAVFNGVTYYGARALMNPIGDGGRTIISNLEAGLLSLAYGYTINTPTLFGTMYGFVQDDGTLQINTSTLGNSNDTIAINADSGNVILRITEGTPVAGIDPTTQFTSIFPQSSVSSININGGDGDDAITVFSANMGTIPITVDGGAGADTLEVDGTQFADSVTVNSPAITIAGKLNINSYQSVESLKLEMDIGDVDFDAPHTGSISSIRLDTTSGSVFTSEAVRVHTLDALTPLTVETFDGDDTLTVGDGDLYQIKSSVNFLGDAGTDSLILNGTTTEASSYAFTTTSVDYSSLVRSTPIYSIRYSTSVEEASVEAGPGDDDFFAAVSNAGFTAAAYGNGGNDGLSTGDFGSGASLDGLLGNVVLHGGPGLDSIYVDDRAAAASRTYTIASDSIKSQVSAFVIFDATVEGVTLDGTNDHNGTYNLAGTVTTTSFTLDGGAVADQFFVNSNAQVNVTLNGGDGSDGLTVDDRNSPGVTQMTLTSTTLTRFFSGTSYTITLNAIDLPSYYAGANTSTINVFGTPFSAFDYYFTLYGGTGANTFNVRPHDPDTGATTFLSRLDITGQGGVDTMILDDSTSPVPVHYTITGADQPNFWLYYDSPDVPTMLIEKDVENATLIGSAADDSYDLKSANIHQFISILGGNGDDTVTAGSGDLRANIPVLGSFIFDGEGDIDTFTLQNNLTTEDWTYTQPPGFIQANAANYVVGFHTTAEQITILSGSGHDQFLIQAAGPDVPQPGGAQLSPPAPDEHVDNGYVDTYDGGDGGDYFAIGNAGLTADINAAIHILDGIGGNDEVVIDNSADTDPTIAHINGNLVGGSADDNLFGPGGSLLHEGVTNLVLFTRSGADTIFVHPSPTTLVSVNASDAAGSSDALNLALADAVNLVATANPDGSVTYTSDNYQPLTVDGFDTTTIDDIAPFVVDAQLDFDVPVQDLTVDFSEDVSASFNTGNVIVTNTTTGLELSQGVMQLDYNPDSNRATITFPGLPQGALPDGNYHILIALSYTDAFGNPATEPFEFDSFVLSADANHDRSVDTADFMALALNFSQTNATFTQGDFNYDGIVNALDFNVIATNFGTYLAPPSPQATAMNAEAPPALAPLARQSASARQSLLFSDHRFPGEGIDRLLA